MGKFWMIIFVLIWVLGLKPQKLAAQSQLPRAIETLLEQMEEDENGLQDITLMEDLIFFLENPLDLNNATKENLQKLQILSPIQIQNLIVYREKYGQILSIHELNLISGFSHELTQSLAPFLTVQQDFNTNPDQKVRRAKQQLLFRSSRILEKQEGYQNYSQEDFDTPESYQNKVNSRFLGNPYSYYARYQFQSGSGKILGGLTTEKDPGEAFFNSQQSEGFDYYSAHLQWKGDGTIQQINLGDYQVNFGQGLCLWSGFGGSKSSMVVQNAKQAKGIRKYSSTDENRFFRGVAIQLALGKKIKISLFGSKKKRDASVQTTGVGQDTSDFFASFATNGLHRNYNESLKKHSLTEMAWGGNMQYRSNKWEVGASWLGYQYTPPIAAKDQAYQLYQFNGASNFNTSVHYQVLSRKIHLYGELAYSQSGGLAMLQGVHLQTADQIAFELIYRNYESNYQSLYANAFGESSSPQNEKGIYLGAELHPIAKWKISAYFDLYQFPWLRYRMNAPGDGNDFFVQLHFHPNDQLLLYLRYKREVKQENEAAISGIDTPQEMNKSQYRLQLSYQLHPAIELRNRFEVSNYEKANQEEFGYILYQDIILRTLNQKLSMQFRFALFDTESYQSRIYTYENDLLYTFSVPSYFNKGTRTYLNLRYRFSRFASIYLKVAQTKYADIETIGSGLTEIQGNTKTELKAQVQIKF